VSFFGHCVRDHAPFLAFKGSLDVLLALFEAQVVFFGELGYGRLEANVPVWQRARADSLTSYLFPTRPDFGPGITRLEKDGRSAGTLNKGSADMLTSFILSSSLSASEAAS